MAFAIFAPPVIRDLESQNKSVPFPLIIVGLPKGTPAVDKFMTTKPPWAPPVMLEPVSCAWELLSTMTPWPLLLETTRLGPAFSVEPLVTNTAPVLPPYGCPALFIRSLALLKLSKEPSLTTAPLKFVPDGLSTITSMPSAVGSKLTRSTSPPLLMLMLCCISRIVIPCTVTIRDMQQSININSGGDVDLVNFNAM